MNSVSGRGPGLALSWSEGETRRLLPLRPGRPLVLGRDADCDGVFAHQTVSRRHAMIYMKDGRAYLRPLSKVSPTWLGGRLVLGDAPLTAGDRLQLAIVSVDLISWDGPDESSDENSELREES